jgi:eukaryotic-like serine/threonine-protein kinase
LTRLSDKALHRLRAAAGRPDFSGTKYTLLEELARGGMGTIYRARDTALHRDVAIKVLTLPELSPRDAERLLLEARILARLEHPGIVPVHDLGALPDGREYYVMKLVRGRTLDDATAAVPLRERLRIVEHLCQTMAFAHARGVLHRDLKPANVMIGEFGEIVVMDWGVARTADLEECHGTILGTPGYMAPEQAAGRLDEIDERTDVFGLGGILFFLLTGEAPPEGAAGAKRGDRPGRAIPKPLRAVCRRALAPQPADRYPSVMELSRDLVRFESHEPVAAYPEGLMERTARLASRYRTPLALILTYLVLRLVLIFRSA